LPFFSVIIPTYNRAALLREALDSVFAQIHTDYEVLVVDDGSKDVTSSVVASYGDRVRYFQQQNQGPGSARNLGIKYAAGEYIAFLDSDDLWFSWTLKTYHQAISYAAKPAFVCGREVKIDAGLDLAAIKPEDAIFTNYPDYLSSSHESIWIGTCSVAIKTSILRAVGAFQDEHINAEDSDLWLRLGTAPGFVRINSPIVFCHRSTKGSEVMNSKRTFRGYVSLIDTEKRGAYPGGQLRYRERWTILTRHVRPGSIGLLKEKHYYNALTLYYLSFFQQLALRKFKYIIGFWFLLAYWIFLNAISRIFKIFCRTLI
jgi:glycosyltransferase involved in cell wall biosynthesis